jgi:RNA polymerase-binding transcription factor DksA
MTNEKMEFYKNKLQHERILLLREIKDLEKPLDFGSDIDHFEEGTEEVEDISNRFGEENDLKKRLDEIGQALQKIEAGGYGICKSCSKNIEEEVLDIDPESALCKLCKTKS